MLDFPEEIIDFKYLDEAPVHFINELIYETRDSYLLYNYGPMLVSSDYRNMFDTRYNEIKHPVLKFITNIAMLKYTVEGANQTTYKEAKAKISEIINRDFTPYRSYTAKIGYAMMDGIKERQYEEHSLESVILTCAPIVQYAKTAIVKPEMTQEYIQIFVKKEIPDLPNKVVLDKALMKYLTTYPIEILKNSESFIRSDDVTSGLIGLNYMTSPEDQVAAIYFLLVYLRYCCGFSDWEKILTKVLNLNTVCNKISNGERVSVAKAVEAFTSFSEEPVQV